MTLALTLRGELLWREGVTYMVVQVVGAVLGVWAAHVMFELPVWQLSTTPRGGLVWFAEAVATFGLLLAIFGCAPVAPAATAYAVGLYITAAYWFKSSSCASSCGAEYDF